MLELEGVKKTWVLYHIFIKFNLFIKYKVGCIEWRVGITTIHTNLIETTPPKIFTWQRNWWKNDLINKNSVVNSNSKPSHILNYDGGGNSTLVSSKQLQSTNDFTEHYHIIIVYSSGEKKKKNTMSWVIKVHL